MKSLQEMVSLVTNKSIRKIDAFDTATLKKESTLYTELFKGINSGDLSDDEEASQFLYQSGADSKKYLMLKGRIKERLVNSIFFLTDKKNYNSDFLFGVYLSNRNYFAAKTLAINGANNAALEYAKSALNLASKFQQSDLKFNCCRLIKSIVYLSNPKEYQKFESLSKKYLSDLNDEAEIESIFFQLSIAFNKSQNNYSAKTINTAKRSYNQSLEIAKRNSSYFIHLNSIRIGLLYYQVIRDYQQLVNTASKMEKLMIDNPLLVPRAGFAQTALYKMSGYMYLQDFENGKITGEKGLVLLKEGTGNWFIFLENYFLLAMHTKNYKEAEALLNMAIGSDRFNSLAITMQEKWKLFEAYLLFIYSGTNVQHEFRIMKFVNEVETLAKDKGGMNPAILIAQLLHIMKKGNWDDAMNRSESLRVYASRNLKPSVAYRTILFIKLLASFVKYRFDKSQLIKRTETNLNKLKSSKISGQENMDALEIIPYEILWESVMQFVTGKRSF